MLFIMPVSHPLRKQKTALLLTTLLKRCRYVHYERLSNEIHCGADDLFELLDGESFIRERFIRVEFRSLKTRCIITAMRSGDFGFSNLV